MIDLNYKGTHCVYIDPEQTGVYKIRDILPRDNDCQLLIESVDNGHVVKALGSELKPYQNNRITRKEFEEAMQATLADFSFEINDNIRLGKASEEMGSETMALIIGVIDNLHSRLFND